MRTTEQRRHDGFWIGVAVFVMLFVTSPRLHAETVPATTPTTTAHYFSSHPMIAGTVVTMNDHQLVVDTEQGERITLEVDTRTMAPRDVATGMMVRTEFAALENCRFHAERIIPVRDGMPSQRLQAYANTRESNEHLATNASEYRHAAMQRPDRVATAAIAAENQRLSERGTVMRAMPGTADHNYSTRPLVSGTVLSVNDHRVVVETDQGRKVAVVMDSRTLVPREIAPGSHLRAEFKQMQDGRYYAQRIHLIPSGTEYREQAYANTMDNDVASAGVVGDCESVVPTPGNAATAASVAAYQPVGSTDKTADQNAADRDGSSNPEEDQVAANEGANGDGSLPETASQRPLFLLLGLLALGAAGAFTYVRLRSA